MVKLKLGEYLDEHNIEMKYVSDASGVRWATVHAYCRNKTKSPNLENISKIMDVLNINDMNLIMEKV